MVSARIWSRSPKALIESHPEANLLARIFLETGRFPHEVFNLPRGERALVYGAIISGGKFKGGSGGGTKSVREMYRRIRAGKGLG